MESPDGNACEVCGASLPSATGVGRPRRTCSDKCRARAHRDRERQVARDAARKAGRCEIALAGRACDRPVAFVLLVDGDEVKVCRTCREPALALLVGQAGAGAIEVRDLAEERTAPDRHPRRMTTVLLVEDDSDVNAAFAALLGHHGFDVLSASTGKEGLRLARLSDVDVVLLDLGLPDMNGIQVLEQLHRVSDVPVIVVTARGTDGDRMLGLTSGAADYLVKPVDAGELVARIHKAIPRTAARSDFYSDAVVRADLLRQEVRVGGQAVALTGREFAVLARLLRSPGVPVATEKIAAELGLDFATAAQQNRLVTVHVANLRTKFRASPLGRDLVVNVRGIGYAYQPPRPSATMSRIGYSHADRLLKSTNEAEVSDSRET